MLFPCDSSACQNARLSPRNREDSTCFHLLPTVGAHTMFDNHIHHKIRLRVYHLNPQTLPVFIASSFVVARSVLLCCPFFFILTSIFLMRHNIEVSFFTTIFPLNLTALPPGPLSHEKLKKGEGETEEILITENPLLSSEIN